MAEASGDSISDRLTSDLDMNFEDRRPVRRSSVEMHEVADELVLFDTAREQAFSLNPSARAIWNMCDGDRTVRGIAEELADVVDEPLSAIREDVESTIQKFIGLEIMTWQHTSPISSSDDTE